MGQILSNICDMLKSKYGTYVILFVSIITISVILEYVLENKFEEDIRTTTAMIEKGIDSEIPKEYLSVATLKPSVKIRFLEQFNTIKIRQHYYLSMIRLIYAKYYKSIMMFIITTIFASILLSIILKAGVENTNGLILTLFLAFTSTAAYYGSFSLAFQHEKNIKNYLLAMKSHELLKNDILTTLSLAPDNESNKSYFDEHIISFDKRLDKAYTLLINFDQQAASEFIQQYIENK